MLKEITSTYTMAMTRFGWEDIHTIPDIVITTGGLISIIMTRITMITVIITMTTTGTGTGTINTPTTMAGILGGIMAGEMAKKRMRNGI